MPIEDGEVVFVDKCVEEPIKRPHGGSLAENEIAVLSCAGEPAPAPPECAHHPENADVTKVDRRYVTAAMMVVMVLASMEQTVTSTAMPTIIGELHGLEHYAWVASIYLLACTVSMPLYGRLADTLGRKKVVLVAIALFCIASVLAASLDAA